MAAIPPVTFHVAGKRLWPVRFLGAAVTAAGVWLLVRSEPWPVGAVTCLFGAFLLVVFGHLLGGRPRLLWCDATGIHSPLASFGHVPWSVVATLRLVTVGRRPFLAVDRIVAERTVRPPLQVAFASLAQVDDLVLPIEALAASPPDVHAAIDQARRQALGGG